MLNPHAATISKVTGTWVDLAGKRSMQYKPNAYPYYYYPYGAVAAVLVSRYPNKDVRFNVTLGGLSSLEMRAMDRAIVSAYAKAKSPKFDGTTNLGELKETVKGILNPLSGIRSIFKKFKTSKQFSRSSRGKEVLDLASHLSDQWLEYRYGIMPLVLSVQDLIKTVGMNPVVSGGYLLQSFHGGEKIAGSDTKTIEDMNYWVVPFKTAVSVKTSTQVGASVCARLAIDEERLYGLRMVDIPSTAYELVTLSFVLDWFFSVGDWIRAVTPDPKIKVLASSVSISRKYEAKIDLVAYKVDGVSNLYAPVPGENFYRYKVEELRRIVNPNLPSFPIWDDDTLSWMRQLDAVSLGWGKLMNTLSRKKII